MVDLDGIIIMVLAGLVYIWWASMSKHFDTVVSLGMKSHASQVFLLQPKIFSLISIFLASITVYINYYYGNPIYYGPVFILACWLIASFNGSRKTYNVYRQGMRGLAELCGDNEEKDKEDFIKRSKKTNKELAEQIKLFKKLGVSKLFF